jgi:hypothetical protein
MKNSYRYSCLALILFTLAACTRIPAQTARISAAPPTHTVEATIQKPSLTETAPATVTQPTHTPIPSKGTLAQTA